MFGATFVTVRLVTHVLRRVSGGGGSGGVEVKGRHLNHDNLGILTLPGVGAVAVHGHESRRRHPLVATVYGSGLALVVDELALLLALSDACWATTVGSAAPALPAPPLLEVGWENAPAG